MFLHKTLNIVERNILQSQYKVTMVCSCVIKRFKMGLRKLSY